jgi:hydroxymethylbilane synthase
MSGKFVIGSRGSELALWQAEFVKDRLQTAFPDNQFEIRIIRTTGDDLLDRPLSKIGDKGLFTKQIEAELDGGQIDIAVHSLKDLQTEQPAGLMVGAVCEREIPNDVLISKIGGSIDDLPEGATVATGSLRRRSQLLHYRPDLKITEIRGNVPTRFRKLNDSNIDAMILAYAGVSRLGLDEHISQIIPFDVMLPAVGQGAVAVEIRKGDERTAEIVNQLDHLPTRICVTAERAFLKTLEGGCQVPIGAYATLDGDTINLEGMVGRLDGIVIIRECSLGKADDAESLGIELANSLIERGARELLDAMREQASSNTNVAM